jgi:hypothetical protein
MILLRPSAGKPETRYEDIAMPTAPNSTSFITGNRLIAVARLDQASITAIEARETHEALEAAARECDSRLGALPAFTHLSLWTRG